MNSKNRARAPRLISILLLLTIGSAAAARQGKDDYFTSSIAPILQQNCSGCHGARVMRSGLDIRSEQAILKGGSRGPSIVPGKPQESLLYKLVTGQQEPAMPMGGRLSEKDIAAIGEWIRRMEPAAAIKPDTLPVRNQGYSVGESDRHFWAFRKPSRPVVPSVTNRNWVRNEIDAFVLARLEKEGLHPSPQASPGKLIRRLYYDLIGIAPTPQQVAAFERRPTRAAYEQIVDNLLSSPKYGERWARHWLDLARYADSGGYEFDVDRPNAWRYRDWVIKSFNTDMPYNRFILEQLAGDQVGGDSPDALIPTGFLRAGPTVDNANNEETRTDELDDMVSTTSSVFLGLTVGCARCHDHKYDPIPQRDYYRMQAVFYPYKKAERIYATAEAQDQFKARNKELDDQIKPFKQQLAAIEKPVKEKLLSEKTDFQVRLAGRSNGFGSLTKDQFREETYRRLSKDVNIQPEEFEAELPTDKLAARKELQKQIEEINKRRPQILPAAMGVIDEPKSGSAHILKRGDWRNKGDEVGPGFPTVISNGRDVANLNSRRTLAEWIANPENPLTARVVVNRIWKYHFGTGIVKTPSDFGLTGDKPSHPEMLDWLATEFIANGWSWKKLHRQIVLSNTYQQASAPDQTAVAKDPENRLLWRVNPRRIEAEAIRDTILEISGKLNPEMYGPGIYPRIDPDIINTGSRPRWPLDAKDDYSTFRRSIYVFVKRSVPLPLLEVYDCPITVVPAPSRAVSTVSPQALALLNNKFVLEQAAHFAARVRSEAGEVPTRQITLAFRLALSRTPSAREIAWSADFMKSQAARYKLKSEPDPTQAALRDFCHALINLNEFLYVD